MRMPVASITFQVAAVAELRAYVQGPALTGSVACDIFSPQSFNGVVSAMSRTYWRRRRSATQSCKKSNFVLTRTEIELRRMGYWLPRVGMGLGIGGCAKTDGHSHQKQEAAHQTKIKATVCIT
jgi:hypothetical protein